MRTTPHGFHLACLLAAGLLVGCSTPEPAPGPPSAQAPWWPLPPGAVLEQAGTVWPGTGTPTPPHGTLPPDGRTPKERVPRIVQRGFVLVGVNQSQNLLSFRDPVTGELQGFEVDIAREIARDIFGDPTKVEFRFVDAGDYQQALDQGRVDMVLRSMSITAERQERMAFSAPYLSSAKQLMVLSQSGITTAEHMRDKTVCVAHQSTALNNAREVLPASSILKVSNWADCLVALQQHQVDGILADDAILAGIAAQDPYATTVGEKLTAENYGVIVPLHDSDGVIRQINSTLARITRDGTWWRLYNAWLGPFLPTQGPPAPVYEEKQ
ncbi:ABC transporter [Corynebacterium sp. 13CS0277]|uniref:glutamate ABC transporter substrate-binding protein n=1 Tax=Corynebacterium sp. 13CS0277 TaxID=2071994 RepID=UPI000D0279C2|nr:glutamate ABC transporter substrate-binding protein [Corynebacterium sp. 13CS0277]PRQ10588.1 ABC transporter [Corynebacterium sp. 13CS0277]